MSARDELATVIGSKLDGIFGTRDFGPATQDFALADAILAAGYSKPRTITTAEELDALTVGAVVLDLAEWLFRKQLDARYVASGSAGLYSADAIDLPATVLYEPTTHGLTAHQEGTR